MCSKKQPGLAHTQMWPWEDLAVDASPATLPGINGPSPPIVDVRCCQRSPHGQAGARFASAASMEPPNTHSPSFVVAWASALTSKGLSCAHRTTTCHPWQRPQNIHTVSAQTTHQTMLPRKNGHAILFVVDKADSLQQGCNFFGN